MQRLLPALMLVPLLGCTQTTSDSSAGPSVSGASSRRATLMERYSACLDAARAATTAEAALGRCRPELEASLARFQASPLQRAAMVDAIEFDGKVRLGLADDPSADAQPNRMAWAFCLTVKSVELDDAASPAAQVGVAVERACRPFATGSSRAERATPTEVVQRVRSGQW
ncbi:MAG: hypothetical protein U1E60_24590 [Reyranellaceae bacterium]